MEKEVNRKVVLEGLAEASITKWSISLNGEDLHSIVRRACGLEDLEDFTKMLVRVRIEWEPVEMLLEVNGTPLPPKGVVEAVAK